MIRRFLKLVDVASMFGLPRAATIAARWAVRREYLVLALDLGSPLPEIPGHQPMEWTSLIEADIPLLRALNPILSEAEIRRRLQEGQICRLCWMDERPVHYRWDTTRPAYLPYLGLVFRPMVGDFLADETFTLPAFRGRGIDSVGTIAALHRARSYGCRRSITLVAWWNAPSLRASMDKTGRSVVGTIGCWTVGFGRRYFATGETRLDGLGGFFLAAAGGRLNPDLAPSGQPEDSRELA